MVVESESERDAIETANRQKTVAETELIKAKTEKTLAEADYVRQHTKKLSKEYRLQEK